MHEIRLGVECRGRGRHVTLCGYIVCNYFLCDMSALTFGEIVSLESFSLTNLIG